MKNGPGPVLLIRADMDGLPVVEQTGLPFASKVRAVARSGVETGVMHACGHDTHMTAWLGTARRLAAMKDQWSGTLVMILQPGEETGEGAKAMLDDGLYTRFPKPDHVLAFHDAAALPAGRDRRHARAMRWPTSTASTSPSRASAATAPTRRRPRTRSSSPAASSPRCRPWSAARTTRANPAVVTVGSFQAGAKHNIISDEAKLQLTVRSYTPEVRKLLLDGIQPHRPRRGDRRRHARGQACRSSPSARPNITPSTFNTEKLSATARSTLFTAAISAPSG